MRFALLLPLLFIAAPLLADDGAKAIAKQLASKSDEEVYAGLHAAAGNQDKSLTSPICKLLKDKNPSIRATAIEVLATRTEPAAQKKAAQSLAARLKPLASKEDGKEELLKVVAALHDLAQPTTIKALLDSKHDEARDVRQARAMAVANVPSKEAIERLIQYGYKDRKGKGRTRDIATKALAYATGEKNRGGIDGWRRWWKENEKDFDCIDAAEKRAEKRDAAAQKKAKQAERKKKNKNRKKKKNDA